MKETALPGDPGIRIAGTDIVITPLTALPPLGGDSVHSGRTKCDALMLTYPYMGIVNPLIEAQIVQARFGAIVDAPQGRLFVRRPVRNRAFVSGDPADTIAYPRDHAMKPGQDCYDWFRLADESGVEIGFRR